MLTKIKGSCCPKEQNENWSGKTRSIAAEEAKKSRVEEAAVDNVGIGKRKEE
jgi:hypothetical protein